MRDERRARVESVVSTDEEVEVSLSYLVALHVNYCTFSGFVLQSAAATAVELALRLAQLSKLMSQVFYGAP